MMRRIASLILIVGFFLAASSAFALEESPESLCARIHQIKEMSFNGEPVDDEVYNGLMKAGENAIPCLIEKIVDRDRMPVNPTTAPTMGDIRVGDIAFFLILDIKRESILCFLPEKVGDEYDRIGMYAYYRYVDDNENRKTLQKKVCQWYEEGQECDWKLKLKPIKGWPKISVRSVFDPTREGSFLAIISIDDLNRVVKEGQVCDIFEVLEINPETKCVTLVISSSERYRIEGNVEEQKEFCKEE